MDREDIYRSIVTLDEILDYAKTTAREIEVLDLQPDQHMAEMARQIQSCGPRCARRIDTSRHRGEDLVTNVLMRGRPSTA